MDKDKDRFGKNKINKHNMNGIALSQQQKLRLFPDLRLQSRMKYLDKREKDILERSKNILKDQKMIFQNQELTLKELKMRHIKEKLTAFAEKNTV